MFKAIRNANNVLGYDVIQSFATEHEANEFIEGGDGELGVITAEQHEENYNTSVAPHYIKN